MPGPPVSTILTSNDVGLGTNEMKVKGTYILPGTNKAITSRYIFISEEEEKEFIDSHPEYKKVPTYIDLEDGAPVRGIDIPYKIKNQKKAGIISIKTGQEIKPGQKPNIKVKAGGPGVTPLRKIGKK